MIRLLLFLNTKANGPEVYILVQIYLFQLLLLCLLKCIHMWWLFHLQQQPTPLRFEQNREHASLYKFPAKEFCEWFSYTPWTVFLIPFRSGHSGITCSTGPIINFSFDLPSLAAGNCPGRITASPGSHPNLTGRSMWVDSNYKWALYWGNSCLNIRHFHFFDTP